MSYTKPDVIIVQEFPAESPRVDFASLQAVIVGPAYKKIKDFNDAESTQLSIGSYANKEAQLAIPDLGAAVNLMEESLAVYISNYAGLHKIDMTVVNFQGVAGAVSLDSGKVIFKDATKNFVDAGVIAKEDGNGLRGDFIRILYGPYAGYYEVKEIIDDTTVELVDTESKFDGLSNEVVNLEYTTGNYGWSLFGKYILISADLGMSGVVYLSGKGIRTDYAEEPLLATMDQLEGIFGAGEITPENPLAYGMFKALSSMTAGTSVAGIMVESDDVLGYQKAFDNLQAHEVYCIVPLTTNPVVHQVLKEHVENLSKPEEKHERIGLFNTERYTRAIKSGFYGRKDEDTGLYGAAKGMSTFSGSNLNDEALFNVIDFAADGEGTDEVKDVSSGEYTRAVFIYRPQTDFTLSYKTAGGSAPVNIAALSSEGVAVVQLDGDTFDSITFATTAADSENCQVFLSKTFNQPAGAEVHFVTLNPTGTQNAQNTATISGGHRAARIRVFNAENTTANPLVGSLPSGLTLKVFTNDGTSRSVTSAGTLIYDYEITSIQATHDNAPADANKYLIEITALVDAGTYKVNVFTDELATFLSDRIVPGVDQLVIIDEGIVDSGTDSGFKETVYQVGEVLAEDSLTVDKVLNTDTNKFEIGQFPSIAPNLSYRVQTPIITDKNKLAEMYRDISASMGTRRMTHIFAPAVGVSDSGSTMTVVPGYYVACAYAGMTQSRPAQQPLTNSPIAGFIKVFNTRNYFTEKQLNTIASGGTTIIEQVNTTSALTVRHQLTTDMRTIESREYSIIRNADFIAKSARETFRPYIGRFYINKAALEVLSKLGSMFVSSMKETDNLAEGSTVNKFMVNEEQKDSVIMCITAIVPAPLNNITIFLQISL